jgi:hypothetical protein
MDSKGATHISRLAGNRRTYREYPCIIPSNIDHKTSPQSGRYQCKDMTREKCDARHLEISEHYATNCFFYPIWQECCLRDDDLPRLGINQQISMSISSMAGTGSKLLVIHVRDDLPLIQNPILCPPRTLPYHIWRKRQYSIVGMHHR